MRAAFDQSVKDGHLWEFESFASGYEAAEAAAKTPLDHFIADVEAAHKDDCSYPMCGCEDGQPCKADAFNDGSPMQRDANDFCRILTLLGMEEEGDPVAEVERLVARDLCESNLSFPGIGARFFAPNAGEVMVVAKDAKALQAVVYEVGQISLDASQTGPVLVLPNGSRHV